MPINVPTDVLAGSTTGSESEHVFSTWFGTGVTLGAVTELNAGINYQQDVTGTDAITGCTFPTDLQSFMGANVQTYIQMIPDLNVFSGTGSISGTVLTITGTPTGYLPALSLIQGTGVTAGTKVTSWGTATGGAGTYNVNNSQTVGPITITAPAFTAGTVTNQIENILQATTCPGVPTGARELYMPVHYRNSPVGGGGLSGSSSKPQIDFHITRPGAAGAPPSELQEIYVVMRHFIPAELSAILDYNAGANFYVLIDWKSGGYGGSTGIGDYRIKCEIIRSSDGGGLRYKFSADNSANGNWNGSSGIPSVGTSIPNGTYLDGYWAHRSDIGSADADQNCWVNVHMYVKRPTLNYNRSSTIEDGARTDPPAPMYTQDITNGRAWCAVENLTTNTWTVIGDQVGGRLVGNENLPLSRMMQSMCYCTGNDGSDPITYAKSTGLQIFKKPPIALL